MKINQIFCVEIYYKNIVNYILEKINTNAHIDLKIVTRQKNKQFFDKSRYLSKYLF